MIGRIFLYTKVELNLASDNDDDDDMCEGGIA